MYRTAKQLDLTPTGLRRLNHSLAQMLRAGTDLHLPGCRLRPVLMHFDTSAYPAGTTHDWHTHEELHLQMPMTGRFRIGVRQCSRTLRPGQPWLVAPDQEHFWTCTVGGVLLGLHLQIVGDDAERVRGMIRRAWDSRVMICCDRSHRRDVCVLLRTIASEPQWWIDRAAVHFRNWMMALLSATLPRDCFAGRAGHAAVALADAAAKRYCESACRFMLANLHRHISLSTIASQVGISPRHLNRSFHLHLRTSCAAWLIAQRMQLARRLLRSDATVPIKTVAYRCGFSRPAFFAKTYKTHWGVSPSGSRRA